MFGRVRASPVPVECLEAERLPAKMIKDDSLSIYEATLMKLREGSRRRIVASPDEMADAEIVDHNDSERSSAACASEGTTTEITYSSDSDSCITTAQQGRNMTILYMFAKYKQSYCHLKDKGVQNDEVMEVDEGSLTDGSTSFSDMETACVLN